MTEIFLVVEQVAEREHSSVRTIQERIAKGLLPAPEVARDAEGSDPG